MTVREIFGPSNPVVMRGDVEIPVKALAYDSRRVGSGTVFFALKGLASDGMAFMPQALKNGAVACVADRASDMTLTPGTAFIQVRDARAAMAEAADVFYGHPSHRLHVVGVTGTNGKTTTTYMLESIFRAAGKSSGVFGTIQYRIGGRAVTASRTTPESTDLQLMMNQCLDAGCTHIAMEVSSVALDMKRAHAVRFAAAIFTNLTQDHLDFHHDMKQYLRAKLRLFESLDAGTPAVINRDAPEYERVASSTTGSIISFGVHSPADVTLEDCRLSADGFFGTLRSPWGRHVVSSPLAGAFNVSNALAAISSACSIGIPVDAAIKGIAELRAVPGRMERIDLGKFSAVIDYAHSPDALDNLLSSLRPLTRGRLIAIFGCGGDRDRGKRPMMAEAVARHADLAILTNDNPRTEDPALIMNEAERGFGSFTAFEKIADRREAILSTLDKARDGDMIAIAGKGHEDYQILGTQIIHFSDREVVEDWKRQKNHERSHGERAAPLLSHHDELSIK